MKLILLNSELYRNISNGEGFFSWYIPIGLLILLAIAGLSWYIHNLRSTINVLEHVLNCIKCENYTVRISKPNKLFNTSLEDSVYNVFDRLRDRNNQLLEKLSYIENLMNSVDSALLVVDDEGRINWSNRTSRTELLGYDCTHISQLEVLDKQMPLLLMQLIPGEIKNLRFERNGCIYEMAVAMTHYRSKNRSLRLINLRNIHQMLVENEVQATQRLMHVLTHEMMNSLSPIISLSEALREQMQDESSDKEEILQGLAVIQRRSEGLLRFINNYRALSKLEAPVLQPTTLSGLIDETRSLTYSIHSKVIFPQHIPTALFLQIDNAQMVQVLLNLLKNADEACKDTPEPQIELGIEVLKEQVLLWVQDNGCGISPTAIDRIFIPFFTTKQQGSGIGLALCRQIMLCHHGNITVNSKQGLGTRFTLHFTAFEKKMQA